MRVTIGGGAGTQAQRLLTKRTDGKCYGLLIQVIDPITVYFSRDPADINQKDALNNPLGGWVLTGAQATPFLISEYTDDLFAVGSAQGRLEVQQYAISS